MVLQEYYNTGSTGTQMAYSQFWYAQTFEAATNYSIEYVKLLLSKLLTPGNTTISIQSTTDGKPNGEVLATVTVNGNNFQAAANWETLTFVAPCNLIAGTTYAIVINAAAMGVLWNRDGTSPTYAGGSYAYSSNSGSSWVLDTARDFLFENWSASGGGGGLTSNFYRRLLAGK